MLVRFSCIRCQITQSREESLADRCLRCRPIGLTIHIGQKVCGKCELFQGGACTFAESVCAEKVWTRKQKCPLDRHEKPLPRKPITIFRAGRVGFIAASYNGIGGAEVWHQTLLPRLNSVTGFVCINPSVGNGDYSLLGCTSAIGLDAAKQLAEVSDVLVVWAAGERLGEILPAHNPPRVISVTHGDGSMGWSREHMQSQARWAAANVYLCPSAADCCPEPKHWLPNAPDPARIKPTGAAIDVPQGKRILSTMSRIAPEKNLGVLIDAMEHLPGYHLVIAGPVAKWDTDHAESLKARAGDNVSFIEPIHPGDLLAVSNAVLSSSPSEGYGLSMAEAMLAGVPVIAVQTGLLEDCPELARIVPHESSPEQWAAAVLTDFATDPGPRVNKAIEQLNTVETFVGCWERLIDSLAAERCRRIELSQ